MSTTPPQDADYDARVRASFAAQAMMTTRCAPAQRRTWAGGDRVRPRRPVHPAARIHHEGVIATVLDSACGYAALSLMPSDSDVLTVEYKVNLLRPARATRYHAVGHVIKPGCTLTVSQSTVTVADSDEPIAVMTGTLMMLARDGARR